MINWLRSQQVGQQIGKGGFATVHKAINLITGEVVAVKRFDSGQVSKSALATITVRVLRLIALAHREEGGGGAHKNTRTSKCAKEHWDDFGGATNNNDLDIVRFIELVKKKHLLLLVLEFVEGGSIASLVDQVRFLDQKTLI